MNGNIIEVSGLTKSYGGVRAADGIEFQVRKGEIFAVLGPNGAGKTTTLECLEGLRKSDAGGILVSGLDPYKDTGKLAKKIGVQLQSQGLPGSMTVKESVVFFSRYHGMEPDFSLIARLGLEMKMNAQYGTLSVGQQRRLALALALAHNPELIILDEPTAGLDVESRNELHAIISESKAKGITVLLATHDMAEAEKLADRTLVIIMGKVRACASPRELTAGGEGRTKISVLTASGALARELPEFSETEASRLDGGYALYRTHRPSETLKSLLAWIEKHHEEIEDLRVERPSLEERFLEMVGGAK